MERRRIIRALVYFRLRKFRAARFRVKTWWIIITIRKFNVYLRYKKKKKERIEERKRRKNARTKRKKDLGKEVVYRNCIEKYLSTSELIVFNKHSVQDDWRIYTSIYIYIYTEVTVSVFVPSKSRPLYLCQPETLLSHARRITRVSHARAFTTTLDADRRNIRSYPIKMSCLRRTYVGTFVLSRNGIIVPQARDTSITSNTPFRGCLARNPPLCNPPLPIPSLYLHPWCSAVVVDAYNSCLDA